MEARLERWSSLGPSPGMAARSTAMGTGLGVEAKARPVVEGLSQTCVLLPRLPLWPTNASEICDAVKSEPLEAHHRATQDRHVLTRFCRRPHRLCCGPAGAGGAR